MAVTSRTSTITTATGDNGEISVDSAPGEDITIKICDYESHVITLPRDAAKEFFNKLVEVL